jgi:hypothetical protein
MSSGRYTMRGRATQGLAFAGWALAGRDVVAIVPVVGCIEAIGVYSGGMRQGQLYRPGTKSGVTYQGGLKTGQAGC